MRILATLGLLTALLPAQNVLVYDNGSFITDPTAGSGGAPVSELQTLAPYTFFVLGFNVNNAANVRQTDDFTVNSLMQINEIEVFFYNTNAVAPSATGVFLSIFDGNPATGTPNQLIPGAGATTNLIGATGFNVSNTLTGAYRVTSTTLTNTARQIQSVRVTLPSTLTLTNGTYYFQYSITAATTPFFAPITTLNMLNTGNAQQQTGTTYAPLQMTSAPAGTPIPGAFQGLPFKFYGPSGLALPGAITNLGGGCSSAVLAVKGAPVVGGHLRADMTNVNPAALGVIILGISDPNIPLGVCPCTSHASLDVLTAGNSAELQVPLVPNLVGFQLFVQGLTLDIGGVGGVTNCNFAGLLLDLTDGFSFQLNIN